MESNIKKTFFCLIFIIATTFGTAQKVKGIIKSMTSEKINNVSIVFRDATNSTKEFLLVTSGAYQIRLKNHYSRLYIEVSAFGYKSQIKEITNFSEIQTYQIDFDLLKDEINQLAELKIKIITKPIVQEQDTIKYNVASFKDGSERKIIDIIRKLPGIQYNEKSGEIKYKGKSIETVKLDGDDLFGLNYSVGTKNINLDLIEQVQAIENYSNNPLLKGIENSEKVALNLKLKKGKIDISGNCDFADGVFFPNETARNNNSTILSLSQKMKSFGVFSYNNIGKNYSTYDYFSFNQGVEQNRESHLKLPKNIPEVLFLNNLSDERANFNNQYFANYNNTFKIGKKINFKTNLYYLQDVVSTIQNTININQIENNSFVTTDFFQTDRKPIHGKGNIEVNIITSKKSSLEINSSIFSEKISTFTTGNQNISNPFSSNLTSTNQFIKNQIKFTEKLSNKTAIQLNFVNSCDKVKQDLVNEQKEQAIFINKRNQDINSQKLYYNFDISIVGRTKQISYNLTFGRTSDINSLNSTLIQSQIGNTSNDYFYTQKSTYMASSINTSFGALKVLQSLSINYLQQHLTNNQTNHEQKHIQLIFAPRIELQYKLHQNHLFNVNLQYNERPFNEINLFETPILINNRTQRSNLTSLDLQKMLSFNSSYTFNNLFDHIIYGSRFSYDRNQGNFFSHINLQSNSTLISNKFLNEPAETYNFNLHLEKFINCISTTAKIRSNIIFTNNKNIVNNSDLRNNQNQTFRNELFLKTGFKGVFNLENNLSHDYSRTKTENDNMFINVTLINSFKMILKPAKKCFIILTNDMFVPNLKNFAQKYIFSDIIVKYKPKNNFIDFALILKNISNETKFDEIQINDFSQSNYQTKLLEKSILINASFNF